VSSLDLMERRVFYAGQDILKEGSPGRELFIIESGHVEIWKKAPQGKLVLERLGPKRVFGELGLIDDTGRSNNITAISDCVCRVIVGDDFKRRLLNTDPLVRALMRVMVESMRSLDGRIVEMVKKNGALPPDLPPPAAPPAAKPDPNKK